MIRSLAAWLLNNFVGQYVENLTPDQLRLGILEGCFEVQNLPLKRDAFRSSWPVSATAGSIGRITLRTPSMHNLLREAWSVKFEDIEVNFKIKQDEEDDEEDEAKKQERKLRKLATLEETWRNELLRTLNSKRSKQQRNNVEVPTAAQQQGAFYTSWFYSVATTVLKNVQITVERVHVRIVHELVPTPLHVSSYVIGLRIGSIRVENDQAIDDDAARRRIIKVVRIDDVNLYSTTTAGTQRAAHPADTDFFISHLHIDARLDIDTSTASKAADKAVKQSGSAQSPTSAFDSEQSAARSAVSSSASVTSINSVILSGSHLHVSVATQRNVPFTVRMRSSQLRLIDGMCQELTYLERRRRYAATRKRFFDPAEEQDFATNRRARTRRVWLFALECAFLDIRSTRERHKWPFALDRARTNVRYVRLCESEAQPTEEERRFRNETESRLTFDELSLLRRVAFRRAHQRRSAASTVASAASLRGGGGGSLIRDWWQFHSRWWNNSASSTTSAFPDNGALPDSSAALSDEERRLVSEFADETEAVGRANWQTRFTLGCDRFELQLVGDSSPRVSGELLFSSAVSGFDCELESNSLASRSRRFALCVGSIAVFDHGRNIELCQQTVNVNSNSGFPFYQSSNSRLVHSGPLIEASYEERRVIDRSVRRARRSDAVIMRSVRLRFSPICVLLNGAIVDELVRFAACEWRAAFFERVRESLQRYIVEQFEKGTLLLDADIAALEKSLRMFRSNAELNRRVGSSRTRKRLDNFFFDVAVESPRVILCAHPVTTSDGASICCELDSFSVQSRFDSSADSDGDNAQVSTASQQTLASNNPFATSFGITTVESVMVDHDELIDDDDEDDEFATPCATPEADDIAVEADVISSSTMYTDGSGSQLRPIAVSSGRGESFIGGDETQHRHVRIELANFSVFVDQLSTINDQLKRVSVPGGRFRLSQLALASGGNKLMLHDFSFLLRLTEADPLQRTSVSDSADRPTGSSSGGGSFCEAGVETSVCDAADWILKGHSDSLSLAISPDKLVAMIACVDYYLPLVKTLDFVQDLVSALPADSGRTDTSSTLTVRLDYQVAHVSINLHRDSVVGTNASLCELRIVNPAVSLTADSRASCKCILTCTSLSVLDYLQPFGSEHSFLLHCAAAEPAATNTSTSNTNPFRSSTPTPSSNAAAVRCVLQSDLTRKQHSVDVTIAPVDGSVNMLTGTELLVLFFPVAQASLRCVDRFRMMRTPRVKARVSRGAVSFSGRFHVESLTARLVNYLASSYQYVAQVDIRKFDSSLQLAIEWCKKSPSFVAANEALDSDLQPSVPHVEASFSVPLIEMTVAGRYYPIATLQLSNFRGGLENDRQQLSRLCYESTVDSVLLLDRSPYATVYEQRFVCGGPQKAGFCTVVSDLISWQVDVVFEVDSPQYVHTFRLTEELYRQYRTVAAMVNASLSAILALRPASLLPASISNSLNTSSSVAAVSLPAVNFIFRLVKPCVVLPECYCSHRALLVQASEISLGTLTRNTLECVVRRLAFDIGAFRQSDAPTRVNAPFVERFVARAPQPIYKAYDLRADVILRPSGAGLQTPLVRIESTAEPFNFFLDREHYAQLKSMAMCNFGEDIEDEALVAYSKTVAEQFAASQAASAEREPTATECESLLRLFFVFPQISFTLLEERPQSPDRQLHEFARVAFNEAHLLFELNSNSFKVIDLVASSVTASGENQQLVTRSAPTDADDEDAEAAKSESRVQLEFHWRLTKRRFVWSAVLNALALVVRLDTWLKIEQLMFGEIDNPLLSSRFVRHRVAMTKLASVRHSIPLDDREMTLKLNFCNIELLFPSSTAAEEEANSSVLSLRTTCTLVVNPLSQAPAPRRAPSGESSAEADAALCTDGETVSQNAFRRSFALQFLLLKLRTARLQPDGQIVASCSSSILEATRLNVDNHDTLRETCADNRRGVQRESESASNIASSAANGGMVSASTSMTLAAAASAAAAEQHRSVAAFELLLVQTSTFDITVGPVKLSSSLTQLDSLRRTLECYLGKIAAHLERRDREKCTQARRSNQDAIMIRRRKLQLSAKCEGIATNLQIGQNARIRCNIPLASSKWTRLCEVANQDDAWLRFGMQVECAVLPTAPLEPFIEHASFLFTVQSNRVCDETIDIRQLQAKERTVVALGLEFDDNLDITVSSTVLDTIEALGAALKSGQTADNTAVPPRYVVENSLGLDAFCCVMRSVTRTDESGATRLALTGDSDQPWKLLAVGQRTALTDDFFTDSPSQAGPDAQDAVMTADDPMSEWHTSRRQMLIRVDGYGALTSAVLVDQLGTHVRYAKPRDDRQSGAQSYPIRILIDISLDPERQCKLIRLRSALTIKNQLGWPLQLRLDSLLRSDQVTEVTLDAGQSLHVDLRWLYSSVYVRPLLVLDSAIRSRAATDGFSFTTEPVEWIASAEACSEQQRAQLVNCVCHAKLLSVARPSQSQPSLTVANYSDEPESTRSYHFAALIERMRYADVDYQVEQSRTGFGFPISLVGQGGSTVQYTLPYPNHTITFLPAISVVNLLPIELHFYASSNCGSSAAGSASGRTADDRTPLDVTIKPNSERALYEIDFANSGMVFGVRLDHFVRCAELALSSSLVSDGAMYDLWMYDERDRALQLFALVETLDGTCNGARTLGFDQLRPSALRVHIGAHYLLVNKIGLPLLFRQHEVKTLAAGQPDEHELACNREALLFSFADPLLAAYCSARIGRGVLPQEGEFEPRWSERFSLEEGFRVRHLYVSEVCPGQIRPDRVYAVGIECKRGSGPLANTTTVTFLPRYQIENRSSHTLQLAQTCHVKSTAINTSLQTLAHVETLPPGATRPFHFARFDLDQLLSVRLLLPRDDTAFDSDTERALHNSSFSEEALEIYRQRHSPDCLFSAGFRIDQLGCFHVLMRAAGSTHTVYFVHAQIVNIGASICVRFLDADAIPSPYRIENHSLVPIKFYQVATPSSFESDQEQTSDQPDPEQSSYVVRPGSQMAYALDDLLGEPLLNVAVLGDPSASSCGVCDLRATGSLTSLKYENFAYICLAATHAGIGSQQRRARRFSLEQYGELVLDVNRDGRVFLGLKQRGKRSQLWRISPHGYIEHIGSSYHSAAVPFADDSLPENASDFVLDVDELALQPAQAKFVALVVRRRDERRRLTQLWRCMDDGRIFTVYGRLCAQLKGGNSAIHEGVPLMVGPAELPHSVASSPAGAWPSNASHTFICEQVQPGSGSLLVRLVLNGPTRVLQIVDADVDENLSVQQQRATMPRFVAASDSDDFWSWHAASTYTRVRTTTNEMATQTENELEDAGFSTALDYSSSSKAAAMQAQAPSLLDLADRITTTLKIQEVAVSLVSPTCEELALLTVRAAEVFMSLDSRSRQRTIELSIGDVQLDNETLDAQVPVIMFVVPSRQSLPSNEDDEDLDDPMLASLPPVVATPAIVLHASYTKDLPTASAADSPLRITVRRFDDCVLETRKIALQIDEKWLWKLIQFAMTRTNRRSSADTAGGVATERRETLNPLALRYLSFANLRVSTPKLQLGVTTCSNLPRELAELKRSLRIPFIAFEHARVEIAPFSRCNVLEPASFLIDALHAHYLNELRKQAAKILGSVDFLGNPLGLLNDVSEGLAELVTDGNVANLVMNVTHGLSNTAAKVASSLSNSLALDTDFKRVRERIKTQHAQPGGGQHSADHLVAGLKSLAYGVKGGLTSLVTHTYKGAQDDGLNGMVRGAARGLFGTIAKPVAGVLDFASGAASAVRDTSRTALSSKYSPVRVRDSRAFAFARLVRCVFPIPRVRSSDTIGQIRMYKLNSNNYAETFLAAYIVHVSEARESTHVIVSDRRLYMFRLNDFYPEVTRDGLVSSVPLDDVMGVRAAEADGRCWVVLEVAHKHTSMPGLAHPVSSTGESMASQSPTRSATRICCDSLTVANLLVHTVSLVKLLRFNLASFIDSPLL